MWDREVSKESAGAGRYNSEVRVISLEGCEESVRYRIGGIAGERGGGVEVFYCCLCSH